MMTFVFDEKILNKEATVIETHRTAATNYFVIRLITIIFTD